MYARQAATRCAVLQPDRDAAVCQRGHPDSTASSSSTCIAVESSSNRDRNLSTCGGRSPRRPYPFTRPCANRSIEACWSARVRSPRSDGTRSRTDAHTGLRSRSTTPHPYPLSSPRAGDTAERHRRASRRDQFRHSRSNAAREQTTGTRPIATSVDVAMTMLGVQGCNTRRRASHVRSSSTRSST
jgi:hypothetical protein